jgi:heme/copper-type cytochrome/quinol oxidase subunit 2
MNIDQGLLLVLAVSLVCEVIVCLCFSRGVSLLVAVLVPLIASVSLYWLPNLGKFHDAEFRNWFTLFLLVWFVPSAVTCMIAAFVIGWLRRRLNHKKNESI